MNRSGAKPGTSLDRLAARAAARFAERFGRPPRWIAAAPGRVNLIGEHTDYNGGYVLPMAIDRHVVIAGDRAEAARGEARARLYSAAAEPDHSVSFALDGAIRPGPPAWSNYVRGVAAGYAGRGIEPGAFDAVIESDLPAGGGLSSSAALEVAAATLIEAMTGERLGPLDRARLCQRAEREFAGMPCGIMDQYTSIMGQTDALILLDCRTLRAEPVAFDDPAVTLLIANSGVRHELAAGGGAYAERRAACEEAARRLGVPELRDASPARLHAAQNRLGDTLYRRARHVVDEITRTLHAARAIAHRDWPAVGRLMDASHDSLRDDYEVSCAELDLLVELARSIGEAGGVFGARMTGGGFGGCTITLVRSDAAEGVAGTLRGGYRSRTGIDPEVFTTRPAAGARMIEPAPRAGHRG